MMTAELDLCDELYGANAKRRAAVKALSVLDAGPEEDTALRRTFPAGPIAPMPVQQFSLAETLPQHLVKELADEIYGRRRFSLGDADGLDPDLLRVMEHWPALSDDCKRRIMAMCQEASQGVTVKAEMSADAGQGDSAFNRTFPRGPINPVALMSLGERELPEDRVRAIADAVYGPKQ